MVQSFAEDILHAILKELPEQDYNRESLKETALHESVVHFLFNTLDRRLEFEMSRMESTWFDFENPAVQESVAYLRGHLYATAKIPADEWQKTIEHAVRLVTAYLLRPCHTLAGFIFGRDNAALDMPTILRRMQYFSPYSYLSEIFGTYVQHNNIQEMESSRFLDLITQIDRRYVKDFTNVTDWIGLLKPVFEVGTLVYTKGYPVYLFQIFFDDKGEIEFKKRLLFEEQIRGIAKVSKIELTNLLNSVAEAENLGLAQSTSTNHSQNANDDFEGEIQLSNTSSFTAQPVDEPFIRNEVPRWQAFKSSPPIPEPQMIMGNTALALYPVQNTPKPNLARFQSKILNLNDDLANKSKKLPNSKTGWIAVTPTISPVPPPIPKAKEDRIADKYSRLLSETAHLEQAIFGGMHPERRTWYLQKLFDNKLVEYHLFLNRLRGIQSWQKAAELIALEVFMKNKVNIYGEAALSFTDLIESIYQK